MKSILYIALFSLYSFPLILLSSDKNLISETVDSIACQQQAAQWARKIVDHGTEQEVVDCANCVYLSLYVIKLDKKIRTSLATMLSLVGRLKLASNQYEPIKSIYDALRSEVESFSSITDTNKAVLQQWQASISHCQQAANTCLSEAIQELIDDAASATVAWSLKPDNTVADLADQINKTVLSISEKIDSIAAACITVDTAEQRRSDARPLSLDDIAMAESFACNCQDLSICGLALFKVAQEGADGVALGLQSASASLFLAYYTELFKAYKARYGTTATIPFTFSPFQKRTYLPDPAQKK